MREPSLYTLMCEMQTVKRWQHLTSSNVGLLSSSTILEPLTTASGTMH